MRFFSLINLGIIFAILVVAVRLIIQPWGRESAWGFVAIIYLVTALVIYNTRRASR